MSDKPTMQQFATQAATATRRWYGQRWPWDMRVNPRIVSCEEFFVEHWRRFPATSPDGGAIIDGTATPIEGFIEDQTA